MIGKGGRVMDGVNIMDGIEIIDNKLPHLLNWSYQRVIIETSYPTYLIEVIRGYLAISYMSDFFFLVYPHFQSQSYRNGYTFWPLWFIKEAWVSDHTFLNYKDPQISTIQYYRCQGLIKINKIAIEKIQLSSAKTLAKNFLIRSAPTQRIFGHF